MIKKTKDSPSVFLIVTLILSLLVIGVVVVKLQENEKMTLQSKAADPCSNYPRYESVEGVTGTVASKSMSNSSFVLQSPDKREFSRVIRRCTWTVFQRRWGSGTMNNPLEMTLDQLQVGDTVIVNGSRTKSDAPKQYTILADYVYVQSSMLAVDKNGTVAAKKVEGNTTKLTVSSADPVKGRSPLRGKSPISGQFYVNVDNGGPCQSETKQLLPCSGIQVGQKINVYGVYSAAGASRTFSQVFLITVFP